MVNGSLRILHTTPSNFSTFFTMNYPMHVGIGDAQLHSKVNFIASNSRSSQDLGNGFATVFGETLMGLAAGQMSNRTALEQQTRSTKIVAKVNKVSLWTLVGLNFAYAGLGIVFALIALFTTREGHRDVQVKLSAPGLVAELFEESYTGKPVDSTEKLFRKYDGLSSAKIGFTRTNAGGWSLSTL